MTILSGISVYRREGFTLLPIKSNASLKPVHWRVIVIGELQLTRVDVVLLLGYY